MKSLLVLISVLVGIFFFAYFFSSVLAGHFITFNMFEWYTSAKVIFFGYLAGCMWVIADTLGNL